MPTTDRTPAQLAPPGEPNTLYVIDISGYVFRAYHALPPLSNSKGEPTHAVYGVTTMLLKLFEQQRPAMVAVAMDSKERSFRHELAPSYKATRPPPPPDLSQQLVRVGEVIDAYGIARFAQSGMEADDLIASVVSIARSQGLRVVIVSADKDLLQLVDDSVVMYDTMKNKVYGPLETEEKLGVRPEQVRDYLALVGDTSDNIPGVPSVGPKTASNLLRQWSTLDGVYSNLDSIPQPKLKQALTDHKDAAFLSRTMATLREDLPVSLNVNELRERKVDEARLRSLFQELEFSRLLEQVRPAPQKLGNDRAIESLEELKKVIAEAKQSPSIAIFCAVENQELNAGDLLGVGLSWNQEGLYVPLLLGEYRTHALEELRKVLEAERPLKLSADSKQDRVALAQAGVALRGVHFDTMLASYLLDTGKYAHSIEEIARQEFHVDLVPNPAIKEKRNQKNIIEPSTMTTYAACRAQAVWRATEILSPRIEQEQLRSLFYEIELPLAEVLADMEQTGMCLDLELLGQLSEKVDRELVVLEARCTELAGHEFNVGSPRQLEAVLFDELKLPVIKKTKTARSTDHEVLEELAGLGMHELPATILEHRTLAKLKSTYLDALPRGINTKTKRIHTQYAQAVAATGRLSSRDPNLQNIPIRTELGREIRNAFVAPKGWEILSSDYSQIELRVLAHMSGDRELKEAFRTGEDVHIRTARALFQVPTDKVTKEMRGRAKTVNFAVIYGQTQFALARNLKIERAEAKRYIEAFFKQYEGVKTFLDNVVEEAKRTGYVKTIAGRKRHLPDLFSKNRMLREAAERVARNSPIQGSAADIIKIAMITIHREMKKRELQSHMLLTVHDELIFEVPPSERDIMGELVPRHMEQAGQLSVPLVVEQGWGKSWGEAH